MCTNKCPEEAGHVSANNTHLRRSNSSQVSGLTDMFENWTLAYYPLEPAARNILLLQTCFWMYSHSTTGLTMASYRKEIEWTVKMWQQAGRGWAPPVGADATYAWVCACRGLLLPDQWLVLLYIRNVNKCPFSLPTLNLMNLTCNYLTELFLSLSRCSHFILLLFWLSVHCSKLITFLWRSKTADCLDRCLSY